MIRALLAVLLLGSGAAADTMRVATFNVSLARSGPGILFKELGQDPVDPQVTAIVDIIAKVEPDIILLNEFDYDAGNAAIERFRRLLDTAGVSLPHLFARPVNTGVPSGIDLDGDGDENGPGDAFGFGHYPGQYGMAVLSRFPIEQGTSRTFTNLRWQDLPDALLPVREDGGPFPSSAAHEVQRLSSKGHWDVRVMTPDGAIRVLASHPTPPVFDGPEDRNGRRNHDEIGFWLQYLDGLTVTDDQDRTEPFSGEPFLIAGDLNADPNDGDGLRAAIRALIAHPRVQDPRPRSSGAAQAGTEGVNARHAGDPALDTADWDDNRSGNLRVDYVLPSDDFRITGSGVFWPADGEPGAELLTADGDRTSDHRLVWVDVTLR